MINDFSKSGCNLSAFPIIPTINDTVDYLWTLIPFYSSTEEDGFVNLLKIGKNADFEEEEFDNLIRKHIVILLLFVCLYLFSFWIIKTFKTKIDNDELYSGDEDFLVYRIALWICSCSLATSIGAVTLLPFSIIGSEVLQLYPDNYYLKWLNWSLINSMWTYIFALSNLALFFLLPFSYFFLESQGLGFSKTIPTRHKTLKSRIIESTVEEEFDNLIRKHIVILLLFVCLYLFSFWIIKTFKTKIDNDELYSGDEDFLVYRIAMFMVN
uniref:Uncharacterized protein n=1 Tax=Panagrolaimus sp. JU765 TaxID=591449 RepID=A0AC34PZQ1_9BILA